MKFKYFLSFLLFFFIGSVYCDNPVPIDGFTVRSLDPTVNLLSGMIWTSDGLLVCDRNGGTLLLIHDDGETETLVNHLDTPVDVMEYGGEWLILQELEGSLIGVDKKTLRRRTIAEYFIHPTAFTIDDRNMAYITEFETGFLFKVDLKTGEMERIPILFDHPADILFVSLDFLYVADQVGADINAGTVYKINRNGQILSSENNITDPTGLCLSPSGEVYVSTFSIRDSGSGNRQQPFNGGVLRLNTNHKYEVTVSGLLGPTSILFDNEGNLIVLEEPTDSIYRFSASGERTPMLEGFAPVKQAARNNNGDIYVIENTPMQQIKIQKHNGYISSWKHAVHRMHERINMTVDGSGNVYITDPMSSQILVYDQAGNLLDTFNDIVPFYMTGIPTGGIFVVALDGNPFSVHLLNPGRNPMTFPINLDALFTSGFAKSDDLMLLCLANGNIQEFSLGSNKKRIIMQGRNKAVYLSSAPDKNHVNAFWLLDANYAIQFWDGNELIPAAQAHEPGILLPDSQGALFIGISGKRFLIQPESTAVSDWNLY